VFERSEWVAWILDCILGISQCYSLTYTNIDLLINNTCIIKVALLVRLEAKPGKDADVERFLRDGLSLVQEELATTAWFAIRMRLSTFGIFDAFPDESGRQAQLSGRVAAALAEKASELFTKQPTIEKVPLSDDALDVASFHYRL
jgi:hypothetical protein